MARTQTHTHRKAKNNNTKHVKHQDATHIRWRFESVLSYSKPHTFTTLLKEEKEINVHLLFLTRPPGQAEQNDRKVKISRIKKNMMKQKEY